MASSPQNGEDARIVTAPKTLFLPGLVDCRNISIALIDQRSKRVMACLRQLEVLPINGLALASLTVASCLCEAEPHLDDGGSDCRSGLGLPLFPVQTRDTVNPLFSVNQNHRQGQRPRLLRNSRQALRGWF
jgi:hypothetical protein